jgi:hypothetical protein
MPEERFHAQFGEDFTAELIKTAEGKATLQAAIDEYFPYLPSSFGGSKSREQRGLPQVEHQAAHQRRDAPGLHETLDRSRRQVRPHLAGGPSGGVISPLARLVADAASPFESKFRLFAAGRWPLGVVGSTLIL